MVIKQWLASFYGRVFGDSKLSPRRRLVSSQFSGSAQIERLEDRWVPAITASVAGGVVSFVGTSSSNSITFSLDASGNLQHNLGATGGFNSNIDLDSTQAGDQILKPSDITTFSYVDQGPTPNDVVRFDTSTLAFSNANLTGVSVVAGRVFLINGGSISAAGTGTISFTAQGQIELDSGSVVAAVDGAISISTNANIGFVGIWLNGGIVQSTGSGNVSLIASGTTGSLQAGVAVGNGGKVIGGTSGLVTISGTGGVGVGDGTGSVGVTLSSAGESVSSLGADVLIIGVGGTVPTAGNLGVVIAGTTVTAGGAGTATIQGTGGLSSPNSNHGIQLTGSSQVTSSGGAVHLIGYGGGNGGQNNVGVNLSGGTVSAGGSGTVTVEGTGGPGTGASNTGIVVDVGFQIASNGGDIQLVGYSDTTTTNAGISLGGTVSTLANGGNISLTADAITIDGTTSISSPATVTLQPQSATRQISLGAEVAGKLSLSDAELDRITASLLVLGNTNAGAVAVTYIDPANVGSLHVITGDNVTDSNSTNNNIFVASLAVSAVSGMALDIDVTNLAVTNSTTGTIDLTDVVSGTPLTIGTVDGVVGASNPGGALSITNQFASVTINENVSALGDISILASETVGAGQDLSIAADKSVISSTGSVSVRAGDAVTYNAGVLIQAATSVIAGCAPSDGQGNFIFGEASIIAGTTAELTSERTMTAGTVVAGGTVVVNINNSGGVLDGNGAPVNITAPAIAFTSHNGLGAGTSGDPLEIAVSNLEIYAPSTGNFYIANNSANLELGGVTTPPAYPAFSGVTANDGTFRLTTTGTLSLSTAGDSLSYVTGNITLTGTSIVIGSSITTGISGSVTLNATAGSITNTNGAATDVIAASGAVSLNASTTVGSALSPINIEAARLDSNTVSGNGDQYITELDSVLITSVDMAAGNGTIHLTSGTFVTASGSDIKGIISVENGATLGGSGQAGASKTTTVQSGGTLAPGASPGKLTAGDTTLESGSLFQVEIDGTTAGTLYDQLDVTGTVTINNATLATSFGFTPASGDVFVIINNDGTDPVSGTFNSLPEGTVLSLGGMNGIISYVGGTGNDVVLIVDSVGAVPTISSVSADPTNTSPIPVSVTFSEAVTGFVAGDVQISNGTLSNFSGSGTTYTFDVTPSGQGLVTVDIGANVATDIASNGNSAAIQLTRTFDSVSPTTSITSAASNPTSASTIPVTVTFSESVTGFVAGDVQIGNGTLSNFSGSGTTYTFDVTPSGQGLVTVNVGANVATDNASNGNSAATQLSRTFDSVSPTTSITSAASNPTNASTIPVTVTFSEAVTGFVAGDVQIGNGTLSNFSGSGTTYTFDITPGGEGAVTVNVGANVATDAASNGNTAAAQLTRIVDRVGPSLVITPNATVTNASPTLFTFQFTEVITGFDASDVNVTNGTKGIFTAVDGDTYTLAVSPIADGDVTISVNANAAIDAANNANSGATATVTADLSGPVFSTSPNLSVPENTTLVGTIVATDPHGPVRYAIQGGVDQSLFAIDMNSGLLRFLAAPDFERPADSGRINVYQIQISAVDSFGQATLQNIAVTVTNVEERPADITLSSTRIAENNSTNAVVGTFNVTDFGNGNRYTYHLVEGAGDSDNARFSIISNALRITPRADFEAKSSYSIRVRATDQGGLTVEKQFTIQITNVNEVVTDILLTSTSLAENNADNAVVGTLSAIDPDFGGTVSFRMNAGPGSTDNFKFKIVGNTLQIKSRADFESKSSYSIRVHAVDQGGLAFDKQFTIRITDEKESPTSVDLPSTSIGKNNFAQTTVGTLSARDQDSGSTFSFALAGGDGSTDNGSFSIVGNSLVLNSPLNFNVKSTYTIRIRVTDQDGLTFDQQFRIYFARIDKSPLVVDSGRTTPRSAR